MPRKAKKKKKGRSGKKPFASDKRWRTLDMLHHLRAPIVDSMRDTKKPRYVAHSVKSREYTHATLKRELYSLNINQLPFDRAYSPSWARHLAYEMVHGNFVHELADVVVCYCTEKRRWTLVNSQHTLSAILNYMPSDWKGRLNFLKYRVKTLEEVRDLYTRIDRARPRSSNDVAVARLYGSPEFHGVSVTRVRSLARGMRLFLTPENLRNRPTMDHTCDRMLNGLNGLSLNVHRILGKNESNRGDEANPLLRTGAIAIVAATTEKKPLKAKRFWEGVRDCSGTVHGTQVALRDFLRDMKINRYRVNERSTSPELVIRTCIKAWNAWVEGVTLNRRTVSAKDEGPRPEIL